jgi:flagellar protein FlgJ
MAMARPLTGLPAGAIGDNTLAADVRSAQNVRARFRDGQEAGIRAAAQEFEALFLQMVMKSMRATTSQDGFMESDASRFFTGMLDEQMARDISRTGGIGLAKVLEEQLARNHEASSGDSNGMEETSAENGALSPEATPGTPFARSLRGYAAREANAAITAAGAATAGTVGTATAAPESIASPRDFVETLWPHAVTAGRATGIPPQFLIAQAALESGWGKRDIRNADGSPSYNLFGIKAGSRWTGETTEITTTEYINGVPLRQKEAFRSYASYAEAFADYARLLRENPRYGNVLGTEDGAVFAKRLQQAGYATDPAYAEKLTAILNGATLRQALIG